MHGCFAYCAGPKALDLQCGVEDAGKAFVEMEKAVQGGEEGSRGCEEAIHGEIFRFVAWLWSRSGDEEDFALNAEMARALKRWAWSASFEKSEQDAQLLLAEGMALAQGGEEQTNWRGYPEPSPMEWEWVAEKFRPDISRNPERMAQLRCHWAKKAVELPYPLHAFTEQYPLHSPVDRSLVRCSALSSP
ncbi:hypothetical protein KC355_g635 [Hortaea werneckii]|nr:hypothetical protein KC355_g635 [Hortaea werneckii]